MVTTATFYDGIFIGYVIWSGKSGEAPVNHRYYESRHPSYYSKDASPQRD